MHTDNPADEYDVVISEQYDPDGDESLALHVVRLVAVATDQEPTELEPLCRVIDTDALERLVDSKSAKPRHGPLELSFGYEGYQVELDSDGIVSLLRGTE